jgi:hypothetical protein
LERRAPLLSELNKSHCRKDGAIRSLFHTFQTLSQQDCDLCTAKMISSISAHTHSYGRPKTPLEPVLFGLAHRIFRSLDGCLALHPEPLHFNRAEDQALRHRLDAKQRSVVRARNIRACPFGYAEETPLQWPFREFGRRSRQNQQIFRAGARKICLLDKFVGQALTQPCPSSSRRPSDRLRAGSQGPRQP